MAKVSIGSICTYNHENQDWSVYKERLEQWFLANDLLEADDKAKNKRRAVLLSSLSETTFKLMRDLALPKKLNSLEYDAIVQLFDSHFETTKCGFSERNRFYIAMQQSSESLAEWAARVRGLAVDCAFPTMWLNEILRDRFVLGMLSGPERDKLFTMDMADLTLKRALETAQSIRSARLGAAESAPGITTTNLHSVELPVYRVTASWPPRGQRASNPGRNGGQQAMASTAPAALTDATSSAKCTSCGYTGHQVATCKFKRYKCSQCNERGHLRRVCQNKKVQHHFIEVEVDENEGDDGKRTILNISSSPAS